jgi:predicted DNA-binding transcriptional regulator AlpA
MAHRMAQKFFGYRVIFLLTTHIVMCNDMVMLDNLPDKWLDIDEAVAYLRSRGVKITRTTLYSNVSRYKKPKSYKIGRALRFKVSDLDAWIDEITREM